MPIAITHRKNLRSTLIVSALVIATTLAGAPAVAGETSTAPAAAADATVQASASAASATASLDQLTFLSGSPRSWMQMSCIGRHIQLTASNYSWRAEVPIHPDTRGYDWGDWRNHEASYPGQRKLYLAAGNYYWRVCLKPIDGGYLVESSLSKPGSAVARLDGVQWVDGLPMKLRRWGNYLTPVYSN